MNRDDDIIQSTETMRRKFGQLIAILRLEHIVGPGQFWNQQILAEKAGLDFVEVGKIERGQLLKIQPRHVVKIADALSLTPGERHAFYYTSNLIENRYLTRGIEDDPKKSLERMIEMLKISVFPSIIHDVYGDIIAVNSAMLSLYGITIPQLQILQSLDVPYNMMRFVYWDQLKLTDQEGGFRAFVSEKIWNETAIHNMRFFKMNTLPYRTEDYYQYIFSFLMEIPYFRQYWYSADLSHSNVSTNNTQSFSDDSGYYYYDLTQQRAKEYYQSIDEAENVNRETLSLSYYSSLSSSNTSAGTIYLLSYNPASIDTVKYFTWLGQREQDKFFVLDPRWPDKSQVAGFQEWLKSKGS